MTASGNGGARVLLITPPLLQPNAPYAALPAIAGFLKGRGVDVVQEDLSLALVRELFSAEGMETLCAAARRRRRDSSAARFLLENEAEYRAWIEPAVAFLQGHAPEYAWRFAAGALPEGPHFRELDDAGGPEDGALAGQGIFDRARLCASLFLDDVADLFRELLDPRPSPMYVPVTIVGVEKKEPFRVAVFQPDDETQLAARERIMKLLEEYMTAVTTGIYRSKYDDIITLHRNY